jgi:hypothetical protein
MKLISTEAADRQVAPVAIPGEPCPTCRQRVPDAQNVFATGAYGAVPIRTIEPTDPLEPDGPGYAEVMRLLREGWVVEQIADARDFTLEQVAAVEADFLESVA